MSFIESFESAKEYRDKQRPIEQPLYNALRLREPHVPDLSFRTEESEQSECQNTDDTEHDEVTNASHSDFDDSNISSGNGPQSTDSHENSFDSETNDLSHDLQSNGNDSSLHSNDIDTFSMVLVEEDLDQSIHENGQTHDQDKKDPLASVHLNESEEAAFDDIFNYANATFSEEQLQGESYSFNDTPNSTADGRSGKLLFDISLYPILFVNISD